MHARAYPPIWAADWRVTGASVMGPDLENLRAYSLRCPALVLHKRLDCHGRNGLSPRGAGRLPAKPEFPPSRWAHVFAQLVAPLITEITCLRSHELKLFLLVKAHVGSPPGGTTG
jgi:hypothetical protein